jgi:predicted HicB family RNase H-like nuclease
MLECKGYLGMVGATTAPFAGRDARLRDVITFEGTTFADVEQAFRGSIDDYPAFCAEWAEPPNRPYSGKSPLHLSPETHRRAAMRAEAEGISLNQWIVRKIESTK